MPCPAVIIAGASLGVCGGAWKRWEGGGENGTRALSVGVLCGVPPDTGTGCQGSLTWEQKQEAESIQQDRW